MINIRSNQSMLDVCNGLNGNLNQLIEVMLQNNITEFVGNIDKSITFDAQNKVFTTFATSRNLIKDEGVEFWGIEEDFIIS